MSRVRQLRNASDLFSLSLSEFILIMVFVLLSIVAHYSIAESRATESAKQVVALDLKLKQAVKRINKLESERKALEVSLNRAFDEIAKLATSLGAETPEHSQDLFSLVENIANIAESINALIDAPLDLKPGDWKRLVFIKNAINKRGKSLDWVLDQADLDGKLLTCESELERNRERCGTGYPLCQGPGRWLVDLVVNDDGILVFPSTAAEGVPIPFEKRFYEVNEFLSVSRGYLKYAQSQRPECRYQVRWFDDIESGSIKKFKAYSTAIEEAFYDHRLLEDPR